MGIVASSLELIRSVFNRDSVFPQQYGQYHWQTQYGIPYDPLMMDPSMHTGSQFTQYMQDQLRVHQNLVHKVADYEEMAEYPEIGMAYRIYADEATQADSTHGKSIWVDSEDETIQKIANFTLHKNLKIENHLWDMAYEIGQFGNLYEEIICIDKIGVVKINNLRVIEMRRVQDFNGELYGYIQDRTLAFTDITTQDFIKRIKDGNKGNEMVKVYEPWEVAHFRFGAGRQMVYGQSIAEPARYAWKRLTLMEDAMVLHKLTRATQRYVFAVDIGDKPPNVARAVLEKVKNEFKKQKYTDQNGKLSWRFNPLAMDEDLFISKRKGERAVDIDVLSGLDNQQTDDANYFRQKLFASLGVPKSYLGADETIGRANLGSLDVRFSRSVLRLQRSIKSGINHILAVDFASRNIDPDKIDYKLKMVVPSGALEISHMEVKRAQAELAQVYQGLNFPEFWIWTNVIGLSEEEVGDVWKAREREQQPQSSQSEEDIKRTVERRIEEQRKVKLQEQSRIQDKIAQDMEKNVSNFGKRLNELRSLGIELKHAVKGIRE